MICEVCGGEGFVKAAPLSPYSRTHLLAPRVAMWHHAIIVPCFNCMEVQGGDVLERIL